MSQETLTLPLDAVPVDGLQEGDSLHATVKNGALQVRVVRQPARGGRTAGSFVKEFGGKFKLPDAKDDVRLQHIIAKHVK
jgi:hypothetical protein